MKKLTILKILILTKLINQKSMKPVIINISTMVLNLIQNFAIITVNDVDYRVFVFDMTEDDVMVIIKNFEPNES